MIGAHWIILPTPLRSVAAHLRLAFIYALSSCYFFISCAALAQDPHDNRIPKPVTAIPFQLRDEVEVLDAITRSEDDGLLKAFGRSASSDPGLWGPLRLVWNQRISLKDSDYVLCLFDSEGRAQPGDNPWVLALFPLDYKVKTWALFTCEPGFAYGAIVNPLYKPDTYFITVNPSGRNGGQLWFEKYHINPARLEKLGEGLELTKIKEP